MITRHIEIEVGQVIERFRRQLNSWLGGQFNFWLRNRCLNHRLGRYLQLDLRCGLTKFQRRFQVQVMQIIAQAQVEGAVQLIVCKRIRL
ncbi:hypothetical protein D3C77_421530 [compost metagenome]